MCPLFIRVLPRVKRGLHLGDSEGIDAEVKLPKGTAENSLGIHPQDFAFDSAVSQG
jgi:hypothetical protein